MVDHYAEMQAHLSLQIDGQDILWLTDSTVRQNITQKDRFVRFELLLKAPLPVGHHQVSLLNQNRMGAPMRF